MKQKTKNTFCLILVIIALVMASLACSSEAAETSQPVSRPTARPTDPPVIESFCVTPGLLKQTMKEFYGINPNFAYDPDLNFDKVYMLMDTYNALTVAYDETDGCITNLGIATITDWTYGDFDKSGSYLGLIGLIAEDESMDAWVMNLITSTKCLNGTYDEVRTGHNGSTQIFICEDTGDEFVVTIGYTQ